MLTPPTGDTYQRGDQGLKGPAPSLCASPCFLSQVGLPGPGDQGSRESYMAIQ